MREWGRPIYRPLCWLFKHKWLRMGDYCICKRCDAVEDADLLGEQGE